jgi:glutamate-ammonia-ligase adenylyltransferase
VDELVTSGRLRQRKTSEETLEDLRHGIHDADQYAWLRKYHQAELMRIGLRDILGLADEEQYLVELSALADATLQYAMDVVLSREQKRKLKGLNELKKAAEGAPFAIIGLGKLGGAEIDYGSDLDILFVAGENEKKRGKAKRGNGSDHVKLARMAAEVMDLLSKRTEHGLVFHTDARLRPDGEKGALVTSLGAYEEYYRKRAALWELQSLTRTRFIAGNPKIGKAFQDMAARFTNFASGDVPATAFTPKWKAEIHRMRMRIEKERTPAGKDDLAIKTGKGGLVDAEFVAQGLCLGNGWREANTLKALQLAETPNDTGAKSKVRSSKATDGNALSEMIAAYRKLRRVEGILRRWSYEGETVLPDDPPPYLRVALRCGFADAEEFRTALANWRKQIRKGYDWFYP